MAYPPKDAEPTWLFEQLIARPAPSEEVPYPAEALDSDGNQIRIRVMGLRDEELEPKTVKAKRWVREHYKMSDSELDSDLGKERIQQRMAKEVLADAIRYATPIPGTEHDAEPAYPYVFYKDADKVGALPPREIYVLWALWNLVQNRIAPTESSMQSADEVEAWVRVLSEGARPFGFFQLELPVQEELLTKLLSLARSLLDLLSSPPENWQSSLESLRTDWDIGTGSFSQPAAESTQSSSQEAEAEAEAQATLTAEEAQAHAKALLDMARKIEV